MEALKHGGIAQPCDCKYQVGGFRNCSTTDNVEEVLGDMDGILVPGGFGDRGIEGKITAIEYARTHKIPFLGLCLGMQLIDC